MNIELSEQEAQRLRTGVVPESVRRKLSKPWQHGRLADSLMICRGLTDPLNEAFVHFVTPGTGIANGKAALVGFIRKNDRLFVRSYDPNLSGTSTETDITDRAILNS